MSDVPRYELDRESLERDCDLELMRGSGPGGQNRNKRETAARLPHRPSGVVVSASERRSQLQNIEAAYERMAERLAELMHVDPPRYKPRPSRGVVRRRLESKRRVGEKKALRRDVHD